jgi:hypothetical protein
MKGGQKPLTLLPLHFSLGRGERGWEVGVRGLSKSKWRK